MATNALHALWAEPRLTNAPDPGPRDWALVAVFICWSLVEVVLRQSLVLRQDLAPRPLLLLDTLAVLGPCCGDARTHTVAHPRLAADLPGLSRPAQTGRGLRLPDLARPDRAAAHPDRR